jgi:aspartyl-tRNA(Asn)/glutamyl-tRNA(Gln) amidotransferase subunit C
MSIGVEEVRRVALLARLELSPEELSRLTKELGEILDHMAALQRVDTSGIEPMAHALDLVNAFRDDRVTNQPDREALLANAPSTQDGFFAVPKVIE